MKQFRTLLILLMLLAGFTSIAQNKITGTIYDKTTNIPVPNAVVGVRGTQNGVETDLNGQFELSTELNQGQIEISILGFKTKVVNFAFTGSNSYNAGTLYLEEDALEELVIMARGVIDVAEGRRTPIAVSTIKRTEIEEKVGGRDITAAMVNTPSVYVVSESSGFGDTQMYTRGFDQSNTAFLLNGQPINGMEDGNMYWSNWSGMTDIANAIQIQRGLGSSKLAISSVGGTINFITKATDMQPGGFLSGMIGNDAYFKTTVGGSTGLMKNGFGVTALFSHWQGDGYNDGTEGQGQNYFISLGYKVNEKHNLNLLLTGAPQWHNQNYAKPIANQLDKDGNVSAYGYEQFGRRYNNNWGYLNGKPLNDRKNYYHKPVANLNWDWTMNENSNLSTVLYASWGRGGGTGPIGFTTTDPETGLKNFDEAYTKNQASETGDAAYAIRSSVNNHQWYGLVTNFNHKFSDELSFNIGADLRSYKGEHFRQMVNLMGADFEEDATRTRVRDPKAHLSATFSTNPWKALNKFAKNPGEKYGYDYSERINYMGAFTQLEYATDRFSAFFQGSLSNQSNQRWDYYQYTPDKEASEKVTNVGYNVKGGVSYNINNEHFIFGNAGYYSRQPYHDNIYMNFGNDVNPFSENEKILGLEVGYKFVNDFIAINVNAYKTTWENRIETSTKTAGTSDITDLDPQGTFGLREGDQLFTINRGVKQDHMGVELDVAAKIAYNLEVTGFGSIGNWQYKGQSVTETRDEERNLLKAVTTDLEGGKVGNAAQTTFGLGLRYKITPHFSIDANYRHYENLYANVQEKENLELPAYNLVDAGISYRLRLTDKQALSFRFNVNNVFDYTYISESRTALKIENNDTPTYKGINANNQVYFGFGRTWNAAIKFTF